MNSIQISNVVINQTKSLYSLNDLHKASGGQKKHEPHQWFRNVQTQDLIAEIEAQGGQAVQTVNGGTRRGTYVCKELVIAYGMWINAAFALQVIRAFIAAQEQGSLKISPAQKQQIQAAVMARHHRTGEHWQEIYRKLHSFLHVNSYHEIDTRDFERAIQFLGSIPDTPAPVQALQFSEREITNFGTVVYYLDWATRQLHALSEPLKQLGAHKQGVAAWTLWHEAQNWLQASRESLERVAPQMQDSWYRRHLADNFERMNNLPYLN
ncbi:KilA domain protein [Neisseria bacilliformis ATCC BAA-1200]|uniref:KilA domain protein n=1 Tax=Neisseria bacilliformis ATCC BAA-1200 TaxID=888742 RepID=F2BBP8_9NEIS|nr:KilA-N domain-containing protein [Neisseria bacilliformis]EGF11194.1 KilA domain protein [Neisseria bacilliformis ATCC BAA-1200]QMT48231.1 KilA-N domain-containing protein [Neisseria bacilliformis]DAX56472.1 MAG TPA: KilA-N domain [Caudoviricetes sp.]